MTHFGEGSLFAVVPAAICSDWINMIISYKASFKHDAVRLPPDGKEGTLAVHRTSTNFRKFLAASTVSTMHSTHWKRTAAAS